MENKKAYYNAILIAGVIVGLVSVMPAYVNWIVGKVIFGDYLVFAVQIGIMAFAFLTYGKRAAEVADTQGNGYTHARAWGFTVLASVVAGVVTAVSMTLLMHVLEPAMSEKVISEMIAKAGEAPKEAIKMMVSITEFGLSVPGIIVSNVISMVFVGGLVGLFTSLRTRRLPKIS